MHVATVDERKRVRIPDAKPGQVVSVEPGPDGGSWTLIVIEPKPKERFPKGSLLKYITPEYNKEQEERYRASVKGPE